MYKFQKKRKVHEESLKEIETFAEKGFPIRYLDGLFRIWYNADIEGNDKTRRRLWKGSD